MKIPKKLKIGGEVYKVTIGHKSEKGSFQDRSLMLININKELSQSQKEIALFHEIIHAINCQFNDEVFIEFFANAFYQVLKDNNLITK